MAVPLEQPSWDDPLQQLLGAHVIDGYGLLDHTGKCLASFGRLSEELWGADDEPPRRRRASFSPSSTPVSRGADRLYMGLGTCTGDCHCSLPCPHASSPPTPLQPAPPRTWM